MRVNRFITIFLTLAVPFLLIQPSVSAHVEQTDNGVSAVMHIYPDDNPLANQATAIQFVFGGNQPSFNVQTCGCTLTVNNGTNDVDRVGLQPVGQSKTSAKATITFPSDGVYGLSVSGKTGISGQLFKLAYSVRVNPNGQKVSAAAASGINVLLVSAASLVLLGMGAYFMIERGGRYAAK